MKKILFFFFIMICFSCSMQPPTEIGSYANLKKQFLKGWNTWDNRSVLTHVLLPEGLALQFCLEDNESGHVIKHAFTGNSVPGSEKIRTLAHEPDGSYTALDLTWKKIAARVESATKDDYFYWRIIPADSSTNDGNVFVNTLLPYQTPGSITGSEEAQTFQLDNQKITVRAFVDGNASALQQPLATTVYFSTDPEFDLKTIEQLFADKKAAYEKRVAAFGDMADTYDAIQNALNWLVVYDPEQDRAVSPVARTWSYGWNNHQPGGYILFCWDNFFASYMHALASKELAFNEAIQMCREVEACGFVPNFAAPGDLKSRDRSQPPVGSMMVREIYRLHPEKWFLEEVFDNLLTWNRWWEKNRDNNGYLSWGSTPFEPVRDDKREKVQNVHQAAAYESGLDNSPMFDGVPYNAEKHVLELADVGLMGLYIGDCKALAEIAGILGRPEATELRTRAEKYRSSLKTLWSEEHGIFLNKRTDTGEFSLSISPTNFYALIGQAATQEQAERMIKEHFYNSDEFWGDYILPSIARNDPGYEGGIEYWRGSIWAPMNFLVYWGMKNYDLSQARQDLADKSRELLLNNWLKYGHVRENYHAETGEAPPGRSNNFYHWGALLGMINLIEYGYVEI